MRKWIWPLLLFSLLLLGMSSLWAYRLVTGIEGPGAAKPPSGEAATPKASVNGPTEREETTKQTDPVLELLNRMTLEEKLGQMVLVGLDGIEPDQEARHMLKDKHVGGFILFRHNIENATQMLSLLNALKNANPDPDIPLFLAVDEEGGKVGRMPEELAKMPSSARVAREDRPELSYAVGNVIGEAIKAFGLNMNFAPVLDINSNPQNPVIGSRAFGSDLETVKTHGIQVMKGLRSQHVIPVVKHFPGHGDTAVDSHLGLPVVKHDLERLERFELLPFAEAIQSGADAVMVGHILLEQVDARYPASLSPAVIDGLLRQKLGFGGVVITDDMTMGAITEHYPMGEAAVLSVLAGSDIVLVCHTPERRKEVVEALREAAEKRTLTEERIDRSVYRILSLKMKYGLSGNSIDNVDIKGINRKIQAVLQQMN